MRERRLDAAELALVASLVRDANAQPWDAESFGLAVPAVEQPSGVIARGCTKLSMDDGSEDGERICDALSKLQALLPSASVRAADDFEQLGWNAAQQRFDFGARERRALHDDEHPGDWSSVLTLVPADAPVRPATLAAALAAVAAGSGLDAASRHDDVLIGEALEAMSAPEAVTDPLRAVLAACDPDAVARAALARYPEIQHGYHTRSAIHDALRAVTDVPALAAAFVTAWGQPRGTYYYGDLSLPDGFAAAIAAEPLVQDRLLADLADLDQGRADSDLAQRRSARAADLLAASRTPRARRWMIELLARRRGTEASHAVRYHLLLPVIEGLGRHPDPALAPTLLLALHGGDGCTRADKQAILGAAQAAPELTLPVLRSLLERGVALAGALAAARGMGARALALADVIEPYLRYPLRWVRLESRDALAALRGTAPEAEAPGPEPESSVLHPDREVRHEALRQLHDRKDTSLFHSLVIAELIDAELRRVTDFPGLPFSWWEWKGLLPEAIIQGRPAQRAAWVRSEAAAALGPQRILGPIAAVQERPPAEVAAGYPAQHFHLDPATHAALLAAEARALAALL
ncbi:MAG: hypothetical protein IT370_13915 [Deltaproteobacteria bacterium]|nr:hypothetical protein [Deltaproteobacteria bacterium]